MSPLTPQPKPRNRLRWASAEVLDVLRWQLERIAAMLRRSDGPRVRREERSQPSSRARWLAAATLVVATAIPAVIAFVYASTDDGTSATVTAATPPLRSTKPIVLNARPQRAAKHRRLHHHHARHRSHLSSAPRVTRRVVITQHYTGPTAPRRTSAPAAVAPLRPVPAPTPAPRPQPQPPPHSSPNQPSVTFDSSG